MKFNPTLLNRFLKFVSVSFLMLVVLFEPFMGNLNSLIGSGIAYADSTATCSASVTVSANDAVTWSASVSGIPNPITISWSGTDGLSGSGTSTEKTYSTAGSKTATVSVTESGANTSVSCGNINVTGIITPPAGNAPTAVLTALPTAVFSGTGTTLTWSSTDATSCAGTNFNTANAVSGSVLAGPISATTTYSVTCTGPVSPPATASVIVGITPPVATAPTASISALPAMVALGATSTITWSSTNANSCTGVNFATGGLIAGSVVTSPLFATTTYSVTCTGATNPPATASVTVGISSFSATNTAPVITLLGANPMAVTQNQSFADPGATAFDAEDGNISSRISVSGTVNTAVVGTYFLIYSVTDLQGLSAIPVTRTVNVVSGGGGGGGTSTATCSASASVQNGDSIVWSVTSNLVSPQFSWSGDENLTGTSSSVTKVYTTLGVKQGTATVTSNISGQTSSCAVSAVLIPVTIPPVCQIATITSSLTATATVGSPFSYTIVTANSTSTVAILATGLPAGLFISGNTISGTSTTADTFSVSLSSVNACGTDTKTLVITVSPQGTVVEPPVVVSTPHGGGGGGGGSVQLVIYNEKVVEASSSTAILTWDTNMEATGRVVYGTSSVSNTNSNLADFGYSNTSVLVNDLTTSHSVNISGLVPGTIYYFRAISTNGSRLALSQELTLTPSGTVSVSAGQGGGCVYLFDYLKMGWPNDPIEVRKLQTFLKDIEGYSSVSVTGFFDQATFDAVEAFQEKYSTDVLIPWGYLPTSPTGFVYITTKKKINEIYCSTIFPLTPAEQQEISSFKILQESLNLRAISGNSQAQTPISAVTPAQPLVSNALSVPSIVQSTSTSATSTSSVGQNVLEGTSTLTLGPATSSPQVGQGVSNTAKSILAASLSIPDGLGGILKCLLAFAIILIIIFVVGNVIVNNMEVSDLRKNQISVRRILFFMGGDVLALLASFVLKVYVLIIPLMVVFIALIMALIWYATKDDEEDKPEDEIKNSTLPKNLSGGVSGKTGVSLQNPNKTDLMVSEEISADGENVIIIGGLDDEKGE